MNERRGPRPALSLIFFLHHQGRLQWRSLLKEELLGELSGFFYGPHLAQNNLEFFVNILSMINKKN